MRVFWTDLAEAQLRAIQATLAETSPQYANRTVDRITARTQQLSAFPKSGSVLQAAAPLEIRMLVEQPYRILYIVGADHVDILGVVHASRALF